MSKITGLSGSRGHQKQVNVFLDGRLAFRLTEEVAVREGLRVGQDLSDDQIEALARSDRRQRCLDAALHYLSYRPRSEAETRQRLQRRGFDPGAIEATISRLKEQGLIDDVAFARYWQENREAFSPRSQRLTGLELRRKGLAAATIERAVGTGDDAESAYRAGLAKASRLPVSDYPLFRRRLGDYLRRRGFDYEVANQTVSRIWREIGAAGESD